MEKMKAALRGRLLGCLVVDARLSGRGQHVGSLLHIPQDAGLHVGLGLHGCSPFPFGFGSLASVSLGTLLSCLANLLASLHIRFGFHGILLSHLINANHRPSLWYLKPDSPSFGSG